MKRMGKVKLLLIGDQEVGKTSLRKRFMGQKHTVSYMATIGADFAKKDTQVTFNDEEYVIESLIWDLAGQDAYKIVRESFYEGCAGALLVVDITREETFTHGPAWIEELWNHNGRGPIPLIILANKTDLKTKDPDKVLSEEKINELVDNIRNFAREKAKESNFQYKFLETSATDGINVEEAFQLLLKEILSLQSKNH